MIWLRVAALALAVPLAAGTVVAQAPQPGTAPATRSAPPAAAAPKAAPAATPADAATKTPLIDINTASKDELDKLPGIGPARAEAIIKNRPYNGKDELRRKKVLPENVYQGIRERIIARQS
jgi:DNA uptake protein ComE-like DNA-binding protein